MNKRIEQNRAEKKKKKGRQGKLDASCDEEKLKFVCKIFISEVEDGPLWGGVGRISLPIPLTYILVE